MYLKKYFIVRETNQCSTTRTRTNRTDHSSSRDML